MMLMAGMNPAYCAAQLGQSKRVFFETYADWIDEAERHNDRERAKDEAELDRERWRKRCDGHDPAIDRETGNLSPFRPRSKLSVS
jgi:hypothetical protein